MFLTKTHISTKNEYFKIFCNYHSYKKKYDLIK